MAKKSNTKNYGLSQRTQRNLSQDKESLTMQPVIIWTFLASFLDLFAVSLVLPLMSMHLKQLGASHFLMGCMTSTYALTQLVSGPIIGSWSDRIGRQKILIYCMLLVGCCYASMGFVDSLIFILMLRALLGIVKHIQVLIRAVITDRVPRAQQPLVFSQSKVVACLSFTLGPAIGGNLVEMDNGFSYTCCLGAALFLLNAAVVYFTLSDFPVNKPAGSADDAGVKETVRADREGGSIADAIRDLANVDWSIYWDVFALKFLADFSIGAFHNNYSIMLQEKFNVTPKIAGYTISFQSFVAALAGLFVGKVNDRFYRGDVDYRKRSFHGYVLMTIALLGIGMTHTLGVFLLWSMLLSTVLLFMRIVSTQMMINRCADNQRGSILGTGNSISSMARLVTPLMTGLVEDTWGSNSSNILAATSATCGIIVTFWIRKQHPKSS